MELRQLSYAVTTDRLGSFTAAATALSITESGLHKQIRKLENELGVVLFERHGRTIRTTADGVQLLERMQGALDAARTVTSHASDLRDGRTGIVSIGCYPVHITRYLAAAIGRFELTHPGLRVRFGHHPGDQMVEGKQDLYQDLFAGTIDFVFGPLRPKGVSSFAAYEAKAIAVLPDLHPLRHEKFIQIGILRNERFVTLPRGLWLRNLFEEACASAGFTPRVEVETTVDSLVALAQHDYGIGILSDDNLWGRHRDPYPLIVDTNGHELIVMNWLHWRTTGQLSPSSHAFLDFIRNDYDRSAHSEG